MSIASAQSSGNQVLRLFAERLDPSCVIVDLRHAHVGSGFSWGRFGPNTHVIRAGPEPIFAYEAKSRWQRFPGR
jgi:hypothetical protein